MQVLNQFFICHLGYFCFVLLSHWWLINEDNNSVWLCVNHRPYILNAKRNFTNSEKQISRKQLHMQLGYKHGLDSMSHIDSDKKITWKPWLTPEQLKQVRYKWQLPMPISQDAALQADMVKYRQTESNMRTGTCRPCIC